MNHLLIRRSAAAAVAVAALSFGAVACGGGNKAVCDDAIQAMRDFSSQAASSAGDIDGFNKATADLASKLKDLSGQADGDAKTALTDLSTYFGSVKIDTSDPGSVSKLSQLTGKASEGIQKLGTACS